MSLLEKLIEYYKSRFLALGETWADLREHRACLESSAIWQARWGDRAAERAEANRPWKDGK
jgi:hypothetical protein